MSGSQRPNPRRRIAGERRSVRPDAGPATQADPARPATTPTEPTKRSRPPGKQERPARRRASTSALAATGPSGPSWPLIAALGALTLLLVLVAAYLGLAKWDYREVREQDRIAEASRTAPAAAERAAATILSYSHTSLDADERAARRYLTPDYEKKYATSFDKLVRPNAGRLRAKVEAEVKASGVSNAAPERVNVLLYVNQTTTSLNNGGEPQVALNRVLLKMERVEDSWLVDAITSY